MGWHYVGGFTEVYHGVALTTDGGSLKCKYRGVAVSTEAGRRGCSEVYVQWVSLGTEAGLVRDFCLCSLHEQLCSIWNCSGPWY